MRRTTLIHSRLVIPEIIWKIKCKRQIIMKLVFIVFILIIYNFRLGWAGARSLEVMPLFISNFVIWFFWQGGRIPISSGGPKLLCNLWPGRHVIDVLNVEFRIFVLIFSTAPAFGKQQQVFDMSKLMRCQGH